MIIWRRRSGGSVNAIGTEALQGTHAATAESEATDVWLLDGPALVADAISALLRGRMGRSSEVVGGGGLGVDGSHFGEEGVADLDG